MAEAINGVSFKGVPCVKLSADKYTAVISPLYGSSVWRMQDTELGIEVFRYSDEVTAEQIDKAREIWGLPTLYLPNRFDGGLLKTSDAEYHLPVNEVQFNNHIHGWVHKRSHTVEECRTEGEKAIVVTSFTHDENDEMYKYFPVDFKITYIFELSAEGLKQTVRLDNLSSKVLPVSVCTHTCLNAPMVNGGQQDTMRLAVPVGKKCELDDRCLPTEKLLELDDYDKQYKTGEMKPVLHDISNDMYTAETGELDGEPFYGVTVTDLSTGYKVCNEVSEEYMFWNMWNDRGFNGYFCPEPMTAMINCSNLSLAPDITGYKELPAGGRFECSQRFFTKK